MTSFQLMIICMVLFLITYIFNWIFVISSFLYSCTRKFKLRTLGRLMLLDRASNNLCGMFGALSLIFFLGWVLP